MAILFVTHDLGVVAALADRVMVLWNGTVVEEGTRDALFSAPQHEYTQKLFAATPEADLDAIRARVERRRLERAAG